MRLETRADARLEQQARQALERLPLTNPARVRVTVVAGVCRVEGAVTSYEEKLAISRGLARLPGVRALVNQARIAPEELVPFAAFPAGADVPASGRTATA